MLPKAASGSFGFSGCDLFRTRRFGPSTRYGLILTTASGVGSPWPPSGYRQRTGFGDALPLSNPMIDTCTAAFPGASEPHLQDRWRTGTRNPAASIGATHVATA